MKLRTALDQWLAHLGATIKPTTAQTYRDMLASFIEFSCAKRQLHVESITSARVAAWMHWARTERGMKGGCIMDRLAILRRLLEWAKDQKLIAENPVQSAQLPRFQAEKPNKLPFTQEQYERLLAVIGQGDGNLDWRSACVIAWNTGLRFSDVTQLRWDSVRLLDHVLTVATTKKSQVGEQLVIPIHHELLHTLLHLYGQRAENAVYVLSEMQPYYPLYRKYLVAEFRKICDAAGLSYHSFHCFRHGFVTRLLNAGVDPVTIGSITGQSLKQLAEYAHISVDAKRRALEKCDGSRPTLSVVEVAA